MGTSRVAAVNGLSRVWASRIGDEDVACSGLGTWVLLALLAGGSDGAARAELERAIGVPVDTAIAAQKEVVAWLANLRGIQFAAGVWTRADVPLEAGWRDELPPGAVGHLTGGAQAVLDRWVAGATDGEITSLPIMVNPETVMALVSAFVVRTAWYDPFTEVTTDLPLTEVTTGQWRGRRVVRLTRASSSLADIAVCDEGDVSLATLDVRGDNGIDVVLVLGEDGVPASHVLGAGFDVVAGPRRVVRGQELPYGEVGPGVVVEEIESRSDRLVVSTVAFDIESSHDLLALGDVFGLTAAREIIPGHFPGISRVPLAVQQAAQLAKAEFTASGFRTAAATSLFMDLASARGAGRHRCKSIQVTFDRPFGWVALDRRSRLILAFGWVHAPGSTISPERKP